MAIPKAFQGSVDYNNGSTQGFRGTFNTPSAASTTTVKAKTTKAKTPKVKTPKSTTTTTTTTTNKAEKKTRTKKNKTNKPKRPPTNWTNFTKRVSTLAKAEGKKGGPNAVFLASTLRKENPNYKSLTNEQIKTRLATFVAPNMPKKASKTTKPEPRVIEVSENTKNMKPIVFKKEYYWWDEASGAVYSRNKNTNAKGAYVGMFTAKNATTGKPKLNTTVPEPSLSPGLETINEINNETNSNSNNLTNANTVNSTNTELENQGGGGNDPSCGCDLQAGWPSAAEFPRGGIQGGGQRGGDCGCMKWGGKRSSLRKRSSRQNGGGCPTPDACPFPGTGYCNFYAKGGKRGTRKQRGGSCGCMKYGGKRSKQGGYRATKKNRNAL